VAVGGLLATSMLLSLGATQTGTVTPSASSDSAKLGILVELFTSEGCSSCPPADELLRRLDQQRAISKCQIVVLGEHVDYWDQGGWHDRFSSHEFTDRQQEYARRFSTAGPYTPQMVVDGKREFVGNDSRSLQAALDKARTEPKASVIISSADLDGNELRLKLETGALPPGHRRADLYVAVAENSDETRVQGGENSGRRLQHAAVLRILEKIAKAGPEGVERATVLHIPKDLSKDNLRVVAFIQEPGNGAVLGSTVRILGEKTASR